jgi:hypothetical protein
LSGITFEDTMFQPATSGMVMVERAAVPPTVRLFRVRTSFSWNFPSPSAKRPVAAYSAWAESSQTRNE